jgi:hypothetical protein
MVSLLYYRLVYSEDKDDGLPEGASPILINSYSLDGFDLRSLWKGIRIADWNKNIELHYSNGEILLDYVPNNLSWLIFTDRAVSTIQTLVTDTQVFPVSITSEVSKDSPIKANVVNVLTSVSAMNWDKSDYVAWEDDPRDIKVIRNLVMNRSSLIDNVDIFRLEESKNFIIVSGRLKQAIEKEGLLGFGFWEIDVI